MIEQYEEKNCMTHRCKQMLQPNIFFADDKFFASEAEVGKELLGVSKLTVYLIQAIVY